MSGQILSANFRDTIEAMSPGDWRRNLIFSYSGAPKPQLANAVTALRYAPPWLNALCYDDFSHRIILYSAPPWSLSLDWEPRSWTENDDILFADWLQHQGIGVTPNTAALAVEAVAHDRTFHPVIDYLASLQHDGRARLENWLSAYCGVEQSAYSRDVARTLLIAAVARIVEPGCKVDAVAILEGHQGIGKSTAIKSLFHPWFSDELADLGSKDASLQVQGIWGIELSELDAMSRADVSRVKAFISRTTDRFRPPYGRRIVEAPRSCVFVGTTNSSTYLKDETGGRRFLPVQVGKIDTDGLYAVRDQLWAEAVIQYRANVPWWLTKSDALLEAEAIQGARYVGDPWEQPIADYCISRESVSVAEIMQRVLAIELGRVGQREQNRVAACLKRLGWERFQTRIGEKREWRYKPKATDC